MMMILAILTMTAAGLSVVILFTHRQQDQAIDHWNWYYTFTIECTMYKLFLRQQVSCHVGLIELPEGVSGVPRILERDGSKCRRCRGGWGVGRG